MDIIQDSRILHLIKGICSKHPALKDYDIVSMRPSNLDKIAHQIELKFNEPYSISDGCFINGKTIINLLSKGIFPKTKAHDKLAAYWLFLFEPKIWNIQKIKEGFKRAKKDFFWNEYLEYFYKIDLPVEGESLHPDINQSKESKHTVKAKYFELMHYIANKESLIIVEGITGSGKSELVQWFAEDCKNHKYYDQIIQPTLSSGLTFEMFIEELDDLTETNLNNFSSGHQIDKLIKILQSKNCLLILDKFENIAIETFTALIEKLSRIRGKTRVIIAINRKLKLLYNLHKNTITLEGYSLEELENLLRNKMINLDRNVLELLFNKTEGISYAIDIFIDLAEGSYTSINEKIHKLSAQPDYRNWIESVIGTLPATQRQLLELLCLLRPPFDQQQIDALSIHSNLHDYVPALQELKDRFFIREINESGQIRFKVLQPIREYYNMRQYAETKTLHIFLANYFWPFENFRAKKEYTRSEVERILEAIYHLQCCEAFTQSQEYLFRTTKYIKLFGFYEDLKAITQFEINHNKNRDSKIDWEYAHTSFILGHIQDAYQIIVPLIIHHFKNPEDSSDSYDTIIAKTIKYIQLYCEILEQTGNSKPALTLLFKSLALFDIADYDWMIRSHALSVISWLYFKNGKKTKAKQITLDLLQDIDLNTRGKAIAHTRLGIFAFNRGNFSQAKKDLTIAYELFNNEPIKDNRAISWCSLYLAFCLYKSKSAALGEKYLRNSLEISRSLKLFDTDTLKILSLFKKILNGGEIAALVEKEIGRFTDLNQTRLLWLNTSQIKKDFEKISALLVGRTNEKFDHKTLLKPIDHTAKPIGSRVTRSVIDRAKKRPESVIQNIFGRKEHIRQIFGCHFYNKLITECLKEVEDKRATIDRYIIPNLSFILRHKDKNDKLRFHYARALEYAGDPDHALILLAGISPNNLNFEYYIIKGNCNKYRDFETSYELYNEAKKRAYTDNQKGRVCNNIAKLIFHKKKTDMYDEAKRMCDEARQYWKNNWKKSFYAITTRILIEIEEADLESVVEKALKLVDRYGIRNYQAIKIFLEVKDIVKQTKLLSSTQS